MVHDSINLSESLRRILSHLHYRALPTPGTILPELRIDHDGTCRGCSLGTNAKGCFRSSDNRSKGILDFVHSYLCGPMTIASLSGSGLMDVIVIVIGWKLQDI
jgi:hypothetical protein